ncbi:hypothetical protein QJR26_08920 [Clostridium baratii]
MKNYIKYIWRISEKTDKTCLIAFLISLAGALIRINVIEILLNICVLALVAVNIDIKHENRNLRCKMDSCYKSIKETREMLQRQRYHQK